MKPDLLLHIGAPKTGSTAIQASLHSARDILADAGACYPGMERNHRFVVSAFMRNPDAFDYNRHANRRGEDTRRHNAECLAALEADIASRDWTRVILSAEHLVLLNPPEIAALRDYADQHFASVTVLLYVRDPIRQSLSQIQEQVKNGAARLEDCLADPPTSGYRALIRRWQTVFGEERLVVRPYTGDLPDRPDIVGDFLQQAGLADLADQVETVRSNVSMSGAGLLLADAFSEVAPKFKRNRLVQRRLATLPGPRFRFSAETLDRVRSKTQAEREFLEETLGLVFQEEPSVSAEPPEPGSYFTEENIRLLGHLLHDLTKG